MNDSQSVRKKRQEDRRLKLLDVAKKHFVAEGYAGTPISAIVKEAGVAQGTFYLYFRSKQDILTELRRQVFRDYASSLQEVSSLPLPVEERLVKAILAMAEAVARNLDLIRVFRSAESAETMEKAILDGREKLGVSTGAFLREGTASGVFRVRDPKLTTQFIVTLFDNVLYESIAYERPGHIDDVVAEGVHFTLRAVGVPDARIASLMANLTSTLSQG